MTKRPITSQISKNTAPSNAVCPKLCFKLSPKYIDTIFGTINPINGIDPMVIMMTDVIKATIVNPTLTIHL